MPISQYKLCFIIADTLVHCIYLPLSLDNQAVRQALDSLLRTTPDVKYTILCGDFNARMGPYTGDNSTLNFSYHWMRLMNSTVIHFKITTPKTFVHVNDIKKLVHEFYKMGNSCVRITYST
ncbi:hypothetical protein G6F46_001258 [Rhizopus delemar]|uniref:Endonuclease/exonuclease/phosphatase domain-containing protein n=3 Tax=Rhizopus TaxID=4842 RepID=I1BQT6_RHIO9|nr:hypothetical protein RO3G_03270 [Rhizopus delemar RA 99-880]KAG1057028.1 hypothetical protein G6F43_001129 [Rhizopus delemar]KAG1553722.1 hypothetical protein G6F51_000425 [Rhizopus arrhizus]KAG1464529.1 hypothetical protein G6F55_001721 [Rhizopus delemar]KAG1502709.1 hypothetical protein G6F54_002176 [Rhizopus delemar]|eukprot:EIE78566.1 hypothetical protein RO3G_03270 [Rhizopus delemar RA 99-880]